MYLVTYLGDLCNGLTLFIISKKQILLLEIWNLLINCMAVTLTTLLFRLLSSPGVIALFSLPLFYRQRQVITVLIHSSYCHFNSSFISISINICFCVFVISQERVDSFIAKIQARIDSVKDTWVWRHLLAQHCHQHMSTGIFLLCSADVKCLSQTPTLVSRIFW